MNLEELLDREPVKIDEKGISESIKGKNILVTGASGSIGSELCRQICRFSPKSIILFDHNENNQFFLEKELNLSFPEIIIIPRLGSITDKERVRVIFDETSPNIVFHCAANKHVPLSEENPSEAVHNNIYGSMTVANYSALSRVGTFIFISTDKAINPTSVMGATKKISELYIQSLNNTTSKFIIVRFGNVLGSAGSVVPIFKSQIEQGKPLTITHPDMLRYFMTIPEATQLVLQAGIIGKGGEIFILDMGKPVKIIDLANKMMKILNKTVEISYTGVRPGEKIVEELLANTETSIETTHSKIRCTFTKKLDLETLTKIGELLRLDLNTSPNIIKQKLQEIVPEATLSI